MSIPGDRYAFLADWYDSTVCTTRRFQLFYYESDGSVEMYDIKMHRSFLRRMQYDKIHLKDLYIGATVTILSRHLLITDYGDEHTFLKLSHKTEKTAALITPNGIKNLGLLFNDIYNVLNLQVTQARMVDLTERQAVEFQKRIIGIQESVLGVDRLLCGRVVLLEMLGENSIRKLRDYLGLTMTNDKEDCQGVPTRVGTENLAKLFYASDSPEAAEKDLDLFFGPSSLNNSATFQGCTCCIIKPHIVKAGLAGKLLNAITDGGFQISALQIFHLEVVNVEEFYEIYKGVVAEYKDMVAELASGQFIALEILSNYEETPKAFRDYAGPSDPDIARQLRPSTLRARFGKDLVQNAIHCSDLPEDGLLEVEYFFKVLQ